MRSGVPIAGAGPQDVKAIQSVWVEVAADTNSRRGVQALLCKSNQRE